MGNKTVTILVHVIIWALYYALPVIILPQPSDFLNSSEILLVLYYIITTLTVALYYLTYYIAIPKYYFKQKYILFVLWFLGFIIITFLIIRGVIFFFYFSYDLEEIIRSGLIRNYLFRFILIFIVALGIRLRKRIRQIESEQLNSELQSLKAQINPHFLFNILNDIYGQAIVKSESTANSIAILSSLMRYVLTEANSEKVALDSEIQYISSYVNLQRLRITELTKVNLEITGNTKTLQIPPLLFIPFIENAFKFGISNEKESKINIIISIFKNELVLLVENEKMSDGSNIYESNQIGLKTTIRRLDLIYGNKYNINITNDDTFYKVELRILNI